MGPMQFLPGTWSRYASDGDGDGRADPQNVFDASLAAARYLCSGGLNLRNQAQTLTAILRYNNSMAYATNVMGWANAYATGVMPVDLPVITGPVPALGDTHLETKPEGLGPEWQNMHRDAGRRRPAGHSDHHGHPRQQRVGRPVVPRVCRRHPRPVLGARLRGHLHGLPTGAFDCGEPGQPAAVDGSPAVDDTADRSG